MKLSADTHVLLRAIVADDEIHSARAIYTVPALSLYALPGVDDRHASGFIGRRVA